jgi:GntR family transcriptional regulator/MocR family aminotransferase
VSRSNPESDSQTNLAVPSTTDPSAGLLLTVDRTDQRGLRSQLERELRGAIQDRRLVAGALLPPSRRLADELGIARSVVVEAYAQLVAEGYLQARQGSGTRVLPVGRGELRAAAAAAAPRVTLVGGLPDPALFPRREWQRHYRAALAELPDSELGYPDPLGAPPLREALARYLARVRGVRTLPERILVTGGVTQALALMCRELSGRGVPAIAVENPGFGFHREVVARAGLRPVPITVDEHGLDVERLRGQDVGAVLIAPAHSYPSGTVLSPERRNALLDWADRRDVLIIEDDYDAEFRYDRAPIGALQGLAPERVAYVGCASKTLSPALRLGWVAAPGWLAGGLARQKLHHDMGCGLFEQLALAGLVEGGGFTRHLRRVRPIYHRRRDAALTALAEFLPDCRPTGVAAGLHLYVRLPATCDERSLVRAARRQGVRVEGASRHWADSASAPPALVLGYGATGEAGIRTGIAALGAIYEGLGAPASDSEVTTSG